MPSDEAGTTAVPDAADPRGRVAVITGARRGIGRALAAALAGAGATVVAAARDLGELNALAESASDAPGSIEPERLDVADPTSVESFARVTLARHEVDILVNNAGVGVFAPIDQLGLEDWNRVFDVNVRGTFLVTQAFLPSVRRRSGHIVNVTSDVSARTFAGGSCYTASKFAQRAFTRALQMEVEADGVRVTEIRPGRVATWFGKGDPPPVGEDHLAPEDVANAIMYALTLPARVRMDEIHFHPRGQTTEF